jgi:alkylation response protein AidB-like acyl-CoA dehydrogenase
VADVPTISFAPTEDQELIRTTARQYLEERVDLARVREIMMSDQGFDQGLWKEMGDMGWPGLAISEDFGGSGLSSVEMSVLLEEMGRLVTPGPFFGSAVLATTAIQQLATSDQQADLLPRMATGETLASLAMFESARNWDPAAPVTMASREGESWVLRGSKRSVIGGAESDLLLVTAATNDGVAVFVVDSGTSGLTVEPEPVLDPTRPQARITLESVQVDAAARLGAGDSSDGLRRVLSLGTAYLAAEQVGGAERCLEMSVDYAKTRYQFGRPIGSYQSIKHRCANMLMKVENAKSAARYAARVVDHPDEMAIAAPLAGAVASEAYVWVAGENIQVHGGIGFTWEHDAHIYLKRAKTTSLLLGDSRHQRDLLGKAIGI